MSDKTGMSTDAFVAGLRQLIKPMRMQPVNDMMLTEYDIRAMLRLFERSPKDAEGWSRVSISIMKLAKKLPDGFVELVEEADGSGKGRLTEKGKAQITT